MTDEAEAVWNFAFSTKIRNQLSPFDHGQAVALVSKAIAASLLKN